jgi:hypothetical protein
VSERHPVFEHFHLDFGFLDPNALEDQSIQRVKNLLPFLDRFDAAEVGRLVDVCQRLGISEWARLHLVDRLSNEDHARYFPSDDQLLEQLDRLAADRHGEWAISFWLEGFDARDDPRERIFNLIDSWLGSDATLRGLRIAGQCLALRGTRDDLPLLDKHMISGPQDEIASLRRSVRFVVRRRSLE